MKKKKAIEKFDDRTFRELSREILRAAIDDAGELNLSIKKKNQE